MACFTVDKTAGTRRAIPADGPDPFVEAQRGVR